MPGSSCHTAFEALRRLVKGCKGYAAEVGEGLEGLLLLACECVAHDGQGSERPCRRPAIQNAL